MIDQAKKLQNHTEYPSAQLPPLTVQARFVTIQRQRLMIQSLPFSFSIVIDHEPGGTLHCPWAVSCNLLQGRNEAIKICDYVHADSQPKRAHLAYPPLVP